MKRTTTTREFDPEGRLVKEVVVEETTPDHGPVGSPWWERPAPWAAPGTPRPSSPLVVR